MSTRTARVEALLRREIAAMLVRGDLRDPRLANAAMLSITGARVSADLSDATVFVDVLSLESGARARAIGEALGALRAGAGLIRTELGKRLRLRRVPTLRFAEDKAIAGAARIEAVLAELRDDAPMTPPSDAGSTDETDE